MGISSLGVGSGILTQDVLDQLRTADEAGRIRPIDLKIAYENDRLEAFKLVDANMTNYIDSVNAIKSASLWDGRSADVTSGTSVSVTASAKTDLQDFTIDVTTLATKQIEESASFGASTDLIATAAGSANLNINGTDYVIAYDATTTLTDFKNEINKIAGVDVDATIVQINATDFRLVVSSANTGASQDIVITDTDGFLSDDGGTTSGGTNLTSGGTVIQTGVNAEFTFNGTAISRADNKVSDLIVGLTLNLEETGISQVSISQDRTSILEKFDDFVSKYNANLIELGKQTKASEEADIRGIFSTDSTMRGMKRALEDMLSSVGGGVGSLVDYGFSVDKSGVLSLDKTILEAAMDTDPKNTQAFFSGGDYVNADSSITVLTGAFGEISTQVEAYTKTNQILDQLKDAMDANLTAFNESKVSATERLDAKYEILKKRFAAFDSLISRINSTSSLFAQITNTQNQN